MARHKTIKICFRLSGLGLILVLAFIFTKTDRLVAYFGRAFDQAYQPVNTLTHSVPAWPVDAATYHSRSVIVYDLTEKQILLHKEIDTPTSIASLTKIMTTILAIEKIEDLNDTARVSSATIRKMHSRNASMAGFRAGENARYIDLLYGTMLPSGGEATLTLAESISGSEGEFAKLMNQRAKELGMSKTTFVNSSGLDAKDHKSTARDLVRLLRHALKNPTFRQIFTTSEYKTSPTPAHPHGLKLKHSILGQVSTDEQTSFRILGGKSGTTYAAGLCWASLIEKNGREFLVVTLGAPIDNLSQPTMHQRDDLFSIAQTIDTF